MTEKWTIEHDDWWYIEADDRMVGSVYKEDDARLIATSPDLLEACEMYLRSQDMCGWDLNTPDYSDTIKAIRTAVANARGYDDISETFRS